MVQRRTAGWTPPLAEVDTVSTAAEPGDACRTDGWRALLPEEWKRKPNTDAVPQKNSCEVGFRRGEIAKNKCSQTDSWACHTSKSALALKPSRLVQSDRLSSRLLRTTRVVALWVTGKFYGLNPGKVFRDHKANSNKLKLFEVPRQFLGPTTPFGTITFCYLEPRVVRN